MKSKNGFKKIGKLFKETISEFINDNVLKLSAALSYYTIFSLPPLIIIATSFCGIYYGKAAIRGDLYEQIKGFVGNKAALQIQELIKNINQSTHHTFATVIGIIVLVIVASGMFSEIQDSINYIWGIKVRPNRGIRQFLIDHIVSFSMIACAGIVLLVSVVITSLMDILNKNLLICYAPEKLYLYYLLNTVLLFLLTTLFIVVIFKTLLSGKIAFRDCLLGASVTSILFMGGKFLIGSYFSSSSMDPAYSTAGSVIIILAWVYYSAIIFYAGVEFTKVYSKIYGRGILPNEYTILIKKHGIKL